MNTQREMFEAWQLDSGHSGPRHLAYDEGRGRYVFNDVQNEWDAWQAAVAAQQAKPVKLQHLAVCDEGVLRWMSGITPRDCELYAMPDGGNAPNVVYIIPTDVMEKTK